MFKYRLFLCTFVSCTLATQTLIQNIQCVEAGNPPPPVANPSATGKEEIAYLDRSRDIYDDNQFQNDPDYQQNWQVNPQAYLQGSNQNNQPRGSQDNSRYQDDSRYQDNTRSQDNSNRGNRRNPQVAYDNDTYYYYNDGYYNSYTGDSGFINNYEKNKNPQRNWDYRENWRYNRAGRAAYLRGEDQSQYLEEEKKRNYYKGRRRNVANDTNQRRVQSNAQQ